MGECHEVFFELLQEEKYSSLWLYGTKTIFLQPFQRSWARGEASRWKVVAHRIPFWTSLASCHFVRPSEQSRLALAQVCQE